MDPRSVSSALVSACILFVGGGALFGSTTTLHEYHVAAVDAWTFVAYGFSLALVAAGLGLMTWAYNQYLKAIALEPVKVKSDQKSK